MGLVKYDIKERDFDRAKSDQYELSILFGMDSFAYLVRNGHNGPLLAYRSVELDRSKDQQDFGQKLIRAVQDDDILRPNLIRELRIGWFYPVHSLVPDRLFNPNALPSYLAQLAELPHDFEYRSDRLMNLHTRLVYGLPSDRRDPVIRRFSPRSEHHLATGLLEFWAKTPTAERHKCVFANFRDDHLFLAGIDQGKLQYFNVFAYGEAKDALYFTLLAYQQCGWSPARIPLFLSGEVIEESAVYRQLYRFIKTMEFSSFGQSTELTGPELSKLPAHLYADLLTIGRP